MTAILGISAPDHRSAAAIIVDGKIVAVARERFTKGGDSAFPTHAIDSCLAQAGLTPEDIDYVGFYDKNAQKYDRMVESGLGWAPDNFRSFFKSLSPSTRSIRKNLSHTSATLFDLSQRAETSAASAFYSSPFENAAILDLDGVGGWTASVGEGQSNVIRVLRPLCPANSMAELQAAFAEYCGFGVGSRQGELLRLARHGDPTYVDLILDKLVELEPDGSFSVNSSYFNQSRGITTTSRKFHKLFGGGPRTMGTQVDQRHKNIASSIQKVVEEFVLRAAHEAHRQTGFTDLCLTGDVALSKTGRGRLVHQGPFERIWLQPAAGDVGGAVGSALFIWFQLLDNPRTAGELDLSDAPLFPPGVELSRSSEVDENAIDVIEASEEIVEFNLNMPVVTARKPELVETAPEAEPVVQRSNSYTERPLQGNASTELPKSIPLGRPLEGDERAPVEDRATAFRVFEASDDDADIALWTTESVEDALDEASDVPVLEFPLPTHRDDDPSGLPHDEEETAENDVELDAQAELLPAKAEECVAPATVEPEVEAPTLNLHVVEENSVEEATVEEPVLEAPVLEEVEERVSAVVQHIIGFDEGSLEVTKHSASLESEVAEVIAEIHEELVEYSVPEIFIPKLIHAAGTCAGDELGHRALLSPCCGAELSADLYKVCAVCHLSYGDEPQSSRSVFGYVKGLELITELITERESTDVDLDTRLRVADDRVLQHLSTDDEPGAMRLLLGAEESSTDRIVA